MKNMHLIILASIMLYFVMGPTAAVLGFIVNVVSESCSLTSKKEKV